MQLLVERDTSYAVALQSATFIRRASLLPQMGEAQYASVVEAATPAMMTTLLLADRFKLDSATAGLMVGWTTLLFWLSLPVIMALGMIK